MTEIARAVPGLDASFGIALIISECQRGILDPAYSISASLADQVEQDAVLPKIAALAAVFRAEGLPVIHAHICLRPDFRGYPVSNPLAVNVVRNRRMLESTPQVDAMPEVTPADTDLVSLRRSGLAMWEASDLDSTLRALKVQTVVLTGVSTNVALPAGAVGATDRGYRVVLVHDAAAAATREQHNWMVGNYFPLVATVANSHEVMSTVAGR